MKVSYTQNTVEFVFGERKVSSKIRSLLNYRSNQLGNLIRRTKPYKMQIIYKYGYSKSTIRRYQEYDIDLPEYKYRSEFTLPGHKITPVYGVTNYLAGEVEENNNFLSNDKGYELVFNLRSITCRMLQYKE